MELEKYKCEVCQHKQKWIPVEIKEPEIPCFISDGVNITKICSHGYVTTKNQEGKTIYISLEAKEEIDEMKELGYEISLDSICIKAWMPLPEPYKEEGEADG